MPLTSPDRAALEHGDLEDTRDLIPPSAAASSNGNGSYNGGNHGKPSLSSSSSSSSSPLDMFTTAGYALCSAVSYAYAYTIYSYHHRRTEFVLFCVLLACSLLAISGKLGGSSGNSRGRGYHNPAILHDWSQISSALDLKLGSIDHWCLRGGDDQCRCEDPLTPSARSETRTWGAAHGRNKKAIAEAVQKQKDAVVTAQAAADAAAGKGWSSGLYENDLDDGVEWYEDGYQDDWTFDNTDYDALGRADGGSASDASNLPVLDVVFLGDSITEQRAGKFFGKETEKFRKAAHVFRKTYDRDSGGKYDGLALGIAGDTAPNLLWRIMHGEMPDDLNPRIWWITVGTNDLGATQCSEEVTLLGILRVVEEILNRKPDSHIVINSILPMSQEKSGILEINGKRPRHHGGRRGRRKKEASAGPTDFWPSIKAVNKQLQKFADKHKSVKFFDATEIFTEKVGNRLVINHDLIEDGVHPTPSGYKKWDAEIVKRIDSIESKDDDGKKAAAADAKAAADAAAAAAAEKQQADMDAAAADDVTDDAYDSYDRGYDDVYYDDLAVAADWDGDGDGDDDWLYAGQDTDDW